MSWFNDLRRFTQQLLTIESRVGTNAEEIKALREDLKALAGFTQKVASAVKRNEEKRGDQHKILVQQLKIELLELERNLSGRGAPFQVIEGGQNRLPDNPGQEQN